MNLVILIIKTPATRSHAKGDKFFDVHTFTPFGQGVFLASEVPTTRIASSDLLTVLPPLEDKDGLLTQGMLELPHTAFSKFMELTSRHSKRYESLWNAWVSKH